MSVPKVFSISKAKVWEAYEAVKSNRGSAGIDGESMRDFEQDLKKNLYKIWNRLSGAFRVCTRDHTVPKSTKTVQPSP